MENVTIPSGLIDGDSMVGVEAPWQFGSVSTPSSLLNRYGNAPGTYANDTLKTYILTNGRDRIEGSQYNFFSWYETGSLVDVTGFVTNSAGYAYVNSVNDDYWNPFGPTVYSNRTSEVALVRLAEGVSYNGGDIYNGTGSFAKPGTSNEVIDAPWVAEANKDSTGVLAQLGLRVLVETGSESYIYKNASSPYWYWDDATDRESLTFYGGNQDVSTGSLWFNAFATRNAETAPETYTVSFSTYRITTSGAGALATMSVWLGNSGSGDPIEEFPIDTTSRISKTYNVVAPQNSDLYFEIKSATPGGNKYYALDSVVVQANKYAQIQDYQVGPLASIGQRNQKYDGCKLTAADWNEDSSDTIDRGPVVTIIEGPGVDLNVDPNTNGTFTFR